MVSCLFVCLFFLKLVGCFSRHCNWEQGSSSTAGNQDGCVWQSIYQCLMWGSNGLSTSHAHKKAVWSSTDYFQNHSAELFDSWGSHLSGGSAAITVCVLSTPHPCLFICSWFHAWFCTGVQLAVLWFSSLDASENLLGERYYFLRSFFFFSFTLGS